MPFSLSDVSARWHLQFPRDPSTNGRIFTQLFLGHLRILTVVIQAMKTFATLPPRADDAASDDDEYLPAGGNVITEDEVASSSSTDDESAPRQRTTAGNRQCASTPAFKCDIEKNVTFSTPDEVGTALQYFKRLFDENIIQLIVDQSNIYSVQETGHSINMNCN